MCFIKKIRLLLCALKTLPDKMDHEKTSGFNKTIDYLNKKLVL